jgi:uncharacterized Fe-S cluster-containing radical SAM superfamily protein
MERPLEIYRRWKQVLGSDSEGSPVALFRKETVRGMGFFVSLRNGDPSPRMRGPSKKQNNSEIRMSGSGEPLMSCEHVCEPKKLTYSARVEFCNLEH